MSKEQNESDDATKCQPLMNEWSELLVNYSIVIVAATNWSKGEDVQSYTLSEENFGEANKDN